MNQVDNPKCKTGHCGVWTRPQKKNPDYKGKWVCPQIDNPAYKGEWAPQQIENPNFFEDKEPHKMASIAAVAIEVWTMSKGMQFDNFYVGHDEAAAKVCVCSYISSTINLYIRRIYISLYV